MKYPVIEKYMIDHNLSLGEFAKRCGIPPLVLWRVLIRGDKQPIKSTIDKILAETGLSYEECFKEEN